MVDKNARKEMLLNGRTLDKRINVNGGIHNAITCLLYHMNLILMIASRNPAHNLK